MSPKRKTEDVLEGKIKTPWGVFTYRSVMVAALLSITPLGDFMLEGFGKKSLSTEISIVKADTAINKVQLERLGQKVDTLIVEVERLRMQRNRVVNE